jgi:serine/threonine protein kinase
MEINLRSIPNISKASVPDLHELARNDGRLGYSEKKGLYVTNKRTSGKLDSIFTDLAAITTTRRKAAYLAVKKICMQNGLIFTDALKACGLPGNELYSLIHGKADFTTQQLNAVLANCVKINNQTWFVIQRSVGQGGFGQVFEATHGDVKVALKQSTLAETESQDLSQAQANKMDREGELLVFSGQTTVGTEGSHVVATYGTAEGIRGEQYRILEYAPGGDAEKAVNRQSKFARVQENFGSHRPPVSAATKEQQKLNETPLTRKLLALGAKRPALILTVRDWVDALRQLALAQIAHRDVKAGNFVLQNDGTWVIIDLETAGDERDQFAPRPGVRPFQLTGNENSQGKSPEWLKSEDVAATQGLPFQVGSKDDVFSLGVAMYRLLSGGRFPFDGRPLRPDAAIQSFKYKDNLDEYVASGVPFSQWHEGHTGIPIPKAWKPLLDGALHAERELRLSAEELRGLELFQDPDLDSPKVRKQILKRF